MEIKYTAMRHVLLLVNYHNHLIWLFASALDCLPEIDLGVTKMGFGFVGAAATGAIARPIPAMILGAARYSQFALGGAKGVYFPVTP